MATTAISNSPLEQFNSITQMHFVRQIGFMLVIAAGIGLSTAIILWSTGGNYTALYLNLSQQDTSEVITVLEQNGVDYQLENGSSIITVPSEELQQTRLLLANNGLPRSTNRGYDVLEDEVTLGTSNFIEQARFNRALEDELIQTIKMIRGVRNARVHISVPKQTSFIRNSSKPSASVMLDLMNSQSIGDMQLSGIVHLVSSSVAGLMEEDVSVVDQRGNLLSRDANSDFSNSNENIRYTREMEADYNQRIIELLTPIVGAGNVHTQVSADLDFTVTETTAELYNPTTASVRSEQTQEENSGAASTPVEPGTLAATPPIDNVDPAADVDQVVDTSSNQSRTSATRNFELDRTVNHIRTVPGAITRLSVAVLVDLHPAQPVIPLPPIDPDADPDTVQPPPPPPEPEVIDPVLDQARLDRLTQLVQDAIGFDIARGDSVNVINESFYQAPSIPPAAALPVWEEPWVIPAAKQLGAVLVVVYLLFGVLRPAMKTVVSNKSALPKRKGEEGDPTLALTADSAQGGAAAIAAPKRSDFDANLSAAQDLVQNEPARAARMIKDWVSE